MDAHPPSYTCTIYFLSFSMFLAYERKDRTNKTKHKMIKTRSWRNTSRFLYLTLRVKWLRRGVIIASIIIPVLCDSDRFCYRIQRAIELSNDSLQDASSRECVFPSKYSYMSNENCRLLSYHTNNYRSMNRSVNVTIIFTFSIPPYVA